MGVNDVDGRISVIVPVYNYEEYVGQCVQSLVDQTYDNLEIVIINDGSTDSSRDIILDILGRSGRLYKYYETNGPSMYSIMGLAWVYFVGVGNSTGRFISYHGADNFSSPERFAKLMERLKELPFGYSVYSTSVTVDSNGKPYREYEHDFVANDSMLEDVLYTFITDYNPHKHNDFAGRWQLLGDAFVFPKICYLNNMLYNSSHICLHELSIYFALYGYGNLIHVPHSYIYFRLHDKQAHKVGRDRTEFANRGYNTFDTWVHGGKYCHHSLVTPRDIASASALRRGFKVVEYDITKMADYAINAMTSPEDILLNVSDTISMLENVSLQHPHNIVIIGDASIRNTYLYLTILDDNGRIIYVTNYLLFEFLTIPHNLYCRRGQSVKVLNSSEAYDNKNPEPVACTPDDILVSMKYVMDYDDIDTLVITDKYSYDDLVSMICPLSPKFDMEMLVVLLNISNVYQKRLLSDFTNVCDIAIYGNIAVLKFSANNIGVFSDYLSLRNTYLRDKEDNYFYVADLAELEVSISSSLYIVPKIIDILFPSSVVDCGCRYGEWLKTFIENGISDVLGIDYLDYGGNHLIPGASYLKYDLSKVLVLPRKFDLVISLEVAEHIDERYAEVYIDNLVSLSDMIVFSAAIPQQGGCNHTNERDQSYWADMFAKRGYIPYDVRSLIWDNENIGWWYRQNIIIYVKDTIVNDAISIYRVDDLSALNLVHPSSPLYKRLHENVT